MDTRDFAGTVKRLGRRMGLSQDRFAAEVGATNPTVNRRENEGDNLFAAARQADRNPEGGVWEMIQTASFQYGRPRCEQQPTRHRLMYSKAAWDTTRTIKGRLP